jgi:hypothetical protein
MIRETDETGVKLQHKLDEDRGRVGGSYENCGWSRDSCEPGIFGILRGHGEGACQQSNVH